MSQNGKLSIVSSHLNALLATITNYANSLYEIDDGALLDKFVNVLRHHCNEYLADYTDPKTWGNFNSINFASIYFKLKKQYFRLSKGNRWPHLELQHLH